MPSSIFTCDVTPVHLVNVPVYEYYKVKEVKHHTLTTVVQNTIPWQPKVKTPYLDNRSSKHHTLTTEVQNTIPWQQKIKTQYLDNRRSKHHTLTTEVQNTIPWQQKIKTQYLDNRRSKHNTLTTEDWEGGGGGEGQGDTFWDNTLIGGINFRNFRNFDPLRDVTVSWLVNVVLSVRSMEMKTIVVFWNSSASDVLKKCGYSITFL